MTKYDWLLLFHLLSAFCFLSGAIVAGILHWLAMRRDRPSEIALLLGLVRPMVVLIGDRRGRHARLRDLARQDNPDGIALGDTWVIAAIVLWAIVGRPLPAPAGKPLRHARELAERWRPTATSRARRCSAPSPTARRSSSTT